LTAISSDQRHSEVLRSHAKLLKAQVGGTSVFNDSKVSSHHAIIPTAETSSAKTLTPIEEKVYSLIVKQFIQALMPPCQKKLTKLQFAHGSEVFTASGSVIIKEGWRAIDDASRVTKLSPDAEDFEQPLPEVGEGEELKISDKKVVEKKTQKPTLLTTSALSRLMATAGKFVENDELSQAMKDCGIGTEATRADIVKRLYELSYIEDQGKFIIPTQDGLQLHGILKDFRIASPELTGVFESQLHQISRGKLTQELFIQEVTALMLDQMKPLGEKAATLESHHEEKESLDIKCPSCKEGDIVIGTNTYHCSLAKWKKVNDAWNNSGCNFQLFKTIAGKKLSPSIIRELLTTGSTKSEVSNLTGKTNKKFSARLTLTTDFKIQFANPAEGATLLCPKCKTSHIRLSQHGASCLDKSCGLFIFRKVAHKSLTDSHLEQLIILGKTGIIKGFKSTRGNFECVLKLSDQFKVEFLFPVPGRGNLG
jgi:DNA topoisomerase III